MSKKLIASAGVVASFAVALAPLATFATGSYYPNTHTDTLNVTIEEVCSFGHTYADGTTVKPGSHTNGTGLNSETGVVNDTPSANIDAGKSYGKWLTDAGADVTDATAYDTAESYKRPAGTGEDWPAAPTSPVSEVKDTAYGVMETNTVNNNFAKTTLAVICNTAEGYQIKAEPDTNLVKTAATDPIPYNGTYAMSNASSSAYNFMAADVTTSDTTVHTPVSAHGASETLTIDKNAFTADLATGGILAHAVGATSTLGDRIQITYGVSIDANQEAGTYEGDITYTLIQL